MSSTLLLPPRAQLCNRSCSNKTHTHTAVINTHATGTARERLGKGEGEIEREEEEVCCLLVLDSVTFTPQWPYDTQREGEREREGFIRNYP